MDGREDNISEEQVLDEELGLGDETVINDESEPGIENNNAKLKTVDFDELKIEDIKIQKEKGK